jgi:hypothetical protein
MTFTFPQNIDAHANYEKGFVALAVSHSRTLQTTSRLQIDMDISSVFVLGVSLEVPLHEGL